MTHAFRRLRSALTIPLLAVLLLMQTPSAFAAGSYISSSTANNGSTPGTGEVSITVAKPASVASGNLLLAAISYQGELTDLVTAPSGWTLIDTATGCCDSGEALRLRTYWKVATSSEPADYTWTTSSAGSQEKRMVGGILQYAGVDPIDPIMAVATNNALVGSGDVTAPSVTTTENGVRVINLFSKRQTGTFGSHANGSTERFDATNPHADGPSLAATDFVHPSAGATGTRTSDPSGNTIRHAVSQTIALRDGGPANMVTVLGEEPASATGNTQVTSASNVSWTDTHESLTSNDVRAYAQMAATSNVEGRKSRYLIVSDFGFAVPSNATILGISFDVERRAFSTAGVIHDFHVHAVKGGAVQDGENRAIDHVFWSTSDTVVRYGGTADKWGTTWTPTQVNAADFGIAFSMENTDSSSRIGSVDHVVAVIHYTVPSSSSSHTSHHPASVGIVMPDGGETFNPGQMTSIVWSSGGTGIYGYRLSFSADGGASFPMVITEDGGLGSYPWTVPDVATTQGRIRVQALDSNGDTIVSSMSSNNFTVTGSGDLEQVVAEEESGSTEEVADMDGGVTSHEPMSRDAANAVLPAGVGVDSLIRLADDDTVYYIGLDAKRHPFLSVAMYLSWYADFSGVQIVDADTLASIPLGQPILVRPGTHWVKIDSDSRTYYVDEGYKLRWVTDELAAIALGGADWNQNVIDINPAFLTLFAEGADITLADLSSGWPGAALVRPEESSTTWYVSGAQRRVFSGAGFAANGFQERFVVSTDAAAGWSTKPAGPAITSFEDVLFSLMH